MEQKFNPGQLVSTAGVDEKMKQSQAFKIGVIGSLQRHFSGDWGDLCDDDKETNQKALETGDRILSSYNIDGIKIWIITESEDDTGSRSATTVLFPSEY